MHFWIGQYSSQDEYGTAAYKTVELDTLVSCPPGVYDVDNEFTKITNVVTGVDLQSRSTCIIDSKSLSQLLVYAYENICVHMCKLCPNKELRGALDWVLFLVSHYTVLAFFLESELQLSLCARI